MKDGEVLVSELDKQFLRGMFTPGHQAMSDEPRSVGGKNLGPSPYDLLLMTLRRYANHKKLDLRDIEVRLRHRGRRDGRNTVHIADLITRGNHVLSCLCL